jgi:putative methyltransferase (TIGR04325 family)
LTPPVVWNFVRRSYGRFRARAYLVEHTYPTFAAAEAAAASGGAGYADVDLARISLRKTLIAREQGLTNISWYNGAGLYIALPYTAALLSNRPLRVLDFGGSFGFHAMVCAKVLPDIATRWAVVESPAVAALARPVESDWLRVFANIGEAMDWLGGVDLTHSSGTLQYLPNPDQAVLNLVNLGARVMLWQRMMFANRPRTYVVQTIRVGADDNGLGDYLPEGFTDHFVRVPCTYVTETEIVSPCSSGGYRLAIRVPPADNWDNGLATFGTILLFLRSQGSRTDAL